MHTSTSFDWQVFDEKDWERGVASGVLTGEAATPAAGADRSPRLPWVSLAGLAATLAVLWLAYAPWPAQRAEATGPAVDYAAPAPQVRVTAREGYLHFSAVDPTAGDPQRRRLRSAYFQWTYDPRAGAAVTAAAAQLDPFYRALHHAAGRGEPAGPLQIAVIPRPAAAGWQLSAGGMWTPLPDLLQMQAPSAAETLLQSLRVALANAVLSERLAAAPVRPQWNFLVEGLRQWFQRCYDPLEARSCAGRLAASTVLDAAPPLSLADLIFTDSDWVAGAWRAERIQAAASLVDYIVDAYGAERLPILLEGLHRHDAWQTLIPAVFGISVEQLERDWRNVGDERR